MPVFIEGEHLHGNMPRGRILFQMVEHGPTQHVWQEYIQRYCSWTELASEGQCFSATHGNKYLEALIVGEIAQHACIMRIILDYQQHVIAWLQIVAIIFNALRRALHQNRR